MPLRYAPTLVIGVADDSGEMAELMRRVDFWLNELHPNVLPVVRIGVADEKKLMDTSENQIGDDIADGLNSWLDAIVRAENLVEVRNEGFELPSDPLIRRIIVAFDSQTDWQRVQAVLDTLVQVLQQRREPTVNLLVAALTQSEDRQQPKSLTELQNWLAQNSQNSITVQLLLLDRYRNDGSNINPDQLPLVLSFVLLVALMPYEASQHWLFSGSPFGKARTIGVGIVYVPLSEIADTAAKWLCHQLSPLALKKEVDEKFLQERWQEMQDALDEAKLWQGIFRGLSDYGIGAEMSDDNFIVQLPEGLVRLDLSDTPWDKWTQRIADWEAKWMLMLQEFWLPKVKEGANETHKEASEKLMKVLDKCVANGIAVKETVEKLMAKLLEFLVDWKSRKALRGIRSTKAELQKLDEAIRQVPNPYAIAARILLIGTVITYFTFVFARWSWLSGFLASWLRNFLPFIEAWMVPALIGLLGLIAILRLIWNGWRTYDEAVRYAEAIKEQCIQAVVEEISSILREVGLRALEQFNQNFEEWAKRTTEDNRRVAESIETQREEWEATFKNFRADDYPLVRSCVQKWEQLEPIFEEAMRGRRYDEIWRQLIKEAQLNSWEQWLHRWVDRSAAKILEQTARKIWRSQLEGEKVKQLSTYSQSEEEWRRKLNGCYDESGRFLWSQVQSGTSLRWMLNPEGEKNLAEISQQVLQNRYGDIRDWQELITPSIIGYLQIAEV